MLAKKQKQNDKIHFHFSKREFLCFGGKRNEMHIRLI